ncbi:MAG: metallophosphoesterase [Steroidobacteraceae bacterium]
MIGIGEPPVPQTLPIVPAISAVVDVHDLDWGGIASAVDARPLLRARISDTVQRLEAKLDSVQGPEMLFDDQRDSVADRAVNVTSLSDEPLWFIGDLHGDLLALEAGLALIARGSKARGCGTSRIVLLGDLFDDNGFGLETVLRVFELILESPGSVCWIAGNHDEALSYDGSVFSAAVSPSDFYQVLNDHIAEEGMERVGKLVVRIVARAPRALFFPDGLLVAHGGFPLADLHQELAERRDWNDPRCLSDFVWSRAHPRARKKLPNRMTRGSQFGYEDFAAFCALSTTLGRSVTHMVRGHDHVDDRYEIYPSFERTPVLTTVALSRRLPREMDGGFVRVPTIARWIRGALPEVHRLHLPDTVVRRFYCEETDSPVASIGVPSP